MSGVIVWGLTRLGYGLASRVTSTLVGATLTAFGITTIPGGALLAVTGTTMATYMVVRKVKNEVAEAYNRPYRYVFKKIVNTGTNLVTSAVNPLGPVTTSPVKAAAGLGMLVIVGGTFAVGSILVLVIEGGVQLICRKVNPPSQTTVTTVVGTTTTTGTATITTTTPSASTDSTSSSNSSRWSSLLEFWRSRSSNKNSNNNNNCSNVAEDFIGRPIKPPTSTSSSAVGNKLTDNYFHDFYGSTNKTTNPSNPGTSPAEIRDYFLSKSNSNDSGADDDDENSAPASVAAGSPNFLDLIAQADRYIGTANLEESMPAPDAASSDPTRMPNPQQRDNDVGEEEEKEESPDDFSDVDDADLDQLNTKMEALHDDEEEDGGGMSS
eukprot:GEZU01015235.1.p1 GENE.GEZU01015235.1~~GEZU01015235.1.p1  ORF type:complete len:380 (-),score=85.18 GEZU01015235.1:169-1308(-)